MTSGLSEKIFGNWLLVARIMTVNITPNIIEMPTATTAENFAAFGRPAPSSFETRTLQNVNPIINYLFRGENLVCSEIQAGKTSYLTAALKPRVIISVQNCKFML